MWLTVNNNDGYIIGRNEKEPDGVPPNCEAFEWYGDVETIVTDVIQSPSGEQVPVVKGVDPRPEGYESHREKLLDLALAANNEIEWLDETIPLILDMDGAEVRAVVHRLALENRKIISAFKYIINRLR